MESALVTVNDLKTLTNIGEHVDPELLSPHLLIAQQVYIQNILGDSLYDQILYEFDNNQLTGYTQTLYEQYLVPAIAYASWYSCSPFINYKTQRSGITTRSSDVDNPVTPEEFSIYNERVKNFMNFYCNRMENYLIKNATYFPNFRQNNVKQNVGGTIFLGWNSYKKTNPYWDNPGGIYGDICVDNNC